MHIDTYLDHDLKRHINYKVGVIQDDDILQRFTVKKTCLLMVASVSHVGALVFWTQAFQHAKAGRIGIVQYS